MNKTITYNSTTYKAVKKNQILVQRNEKEYVITLQNALKRGEMIQLIPVLDELFTHEITDITPTNSQ